MGGQRKALIVANDSYAHEGLRALSAPAADADALAGVLGDPAVGGFDVRVLRNELAHDIEARIEDLFSEARPEDVLLLHFSCHGLKSESGELFFAARNTRPNRLGSTGISADFVQRCMRASRSRSIVLLLDCCYGGAFGQGVTVRATGDVNVLDSFAGQALGGGRGRAVITASSAMEYAFEGERLTDDRSARPSVFTSALVEGLSTGEADRDEDGWVSLNELYDYVFDRVREQTPHQTPSRDIEMSGELYLARSRRRRRIQPSPIPADLRAAVADANMFTRLGAVSELRARLGSDNLPAAAGAHAALAGIARDDIQYVADAAAAALAEARPALSETVLRFGRLAAGSPPVAKGVRVHGPPLARACSAEGSDPRIRVTEGGEGFEVSVDTARPGTVRGTVTVKGPTGEAAVAVEAEVVAAEMAVDGVVAAPAPAPAPEAEPPLAVPPAALSPEPAVIELRSGAGRGPRRVGVLGLVAGGLVMLGLAVPYRYDDPLWIPHPVLPWYLVLVAALAGVGGASALGAQQSGPWSRAWTGPGFFLGLAAASLWGLLILIVDVYYTPDVNAGWWVLTLGHLVLLAAAAVAARWLATSTSAGWRTTWQEAGQRVALAAAPVGAAAMLWQASMLQPDTGGYSGAQGVLAGLALVVPAVAAARTPSRLAASVLAGWVAGASAVVLTDGIYVLDKIANGYEYSVGPLVTFAATLLALAVAAVLLARSEQRGNP